MIGILDYGLGNIKAFYSVYKTLNIPVSIIKNPTDFKSATHIILPGVGSFDWAMNKLNISGLRAKLDEEVLISKKPILGICVGMQMMARASEEGDDKGLCWFDATIKKIISRNNKLPLPHMGWNSLDVKTNPLFYNLTKQPSFYFLHSYYFSSNNANNTLSTTSYSGDFISSVFKENIFGVQFHPEKSHKNGIQLLKNFSQI